MGKVGAQVLQGNRNLFGKPESNQNPLNLDIIQFNSATQQWELVSGVVGSAVQSASNVGGGEGISLPRVGDDLPFRSLTTTSKISLTGSATEIEISIGTLLISDIQGLQTALDDLEPPFLISDITGLQTALDTKIETITNVGGASEIAQAKVAQNVNLRTLLANLEILITTNANDLAFSIGVIAQSKITGLVTALASKLETLTNVGVGVGKIAKAKVGVNNDIKSILAGSGITVNNLTDEIEIVNDGMTVSQSVIAQGYPAIVGIPDGISFMSLAGNPSFSLTEVDRQIVIPIDMVLSRLTLSVIAQKDQAVTWTLNINTVNGNQTISIPASTTGVFQDLVNTDSVSNQDLLSYEQNVGAGGMGDFEPNGASMVIEI